MWRQAEPDVSGFRVAVRAGLRHFSLAPGKSRLIHIDSSVPASVHGDHYTNTVFTVAPAYPGRGTMHVVGAVASSVRIYAPAMTHTNPSAAAVGFPPLWLAAGALIVVTLFLAFVVRRARRVRGKHGLRAG